MNKTIDGIYTEDEIGKAIKSIIDNELIKNKWLAVSFDIKIEPNKTNNLVMIDNLTVKASEVEKEISDKEWIEGHRRWSEAQRKLSKIYN